MLYGYKKTALTACSNHDEAINENIKKTMHFVCIFESTTFDCIHFLM